MRHGVSRRGRPLALLGLVLASWTGTRALMWDGQALAALRPGDAHSASVSWAIAAAGQVLPNVPSMAGGFSPWAAEPIRPANAFQQPGAALARQAMRAIPYGRAWGNEPAEPPRSAVGGWFGYFLPEGPRAPATRGRWADSIDLAAARDRGAGGNAAPAVAAASQTQAPARRWSGDAWLLMRRATGGLAASGGSFPTYGADQAGAVLRYALSLRDPRRPAAYLRVTTALHDSNQGEVALGLQARPFPRIPIAALAEVRIRRDGKSVYARPAAMAVTQLPPLALPGGIVGDAYVQAGYVGGNFSTPFIDGQVRAKSHLGKLGKGELSVGAGSWGGAQKGASRLDVGPEASWQFPLNRRVAATLSLDYRIKVAGNAEPGSGPALSLAAGF